MLGRAFRRMSASSRVTGDVMPVSRSVIVNYQVSDVSVIRRECPWFHIDDRHTIVDAAK